MKTSLKKLTSVFLAVLMLISVFSVVGVSAADTNTTVTGYSGSFTFHPGEASQDNPTWYVWTWNQAEGGGEFVKGTGEGDSIRFDGVGDTVVFLRMESGATEANWDTCWNRTGDISVQGSDAYFAGWSGQVEGKDAFNVTWDGNPGGGGGDNPNPGGGGGVSGDWIAVIYCEASGNDDASRNSEHAFTNGTLTYDFPGDSYVFVRNNNTGVQYCTDGWTEFANPVTLVNENSIDKNNFNKMYVPAGTHTLYLSDNGNDTYQLSYDGGGDNPNPGGGGGDNPNPGGGGGVSGDWIAVIYCEASGNDDASRNSEHAFTNGTLTYDFPGDSYVFVRNNNTGVQYCTDGWTEFANPVTLVNENSIDINNFNKMYVPAGTHTLYLSDNGNDTYQLSYDMPFGGGDITDPVVTDPVVTDPVVTDPVVTDPPTDPPTSAPTQAPTTSTSATGSETKVTDPETTIPGQTGLNIITALNGTAVSTPTNVTGKTVSVSYSLTAPLLLEDAQGTLNYDSSKLKLAKFEVPNVSSQLTTNLELPNAAKFNFTGVNGVTSSGIYDFKNGAVLVKATFSVVDGVTGSTTIDLVIEELDGLEGGNQVAYFTNSTPSDAASAVIPSLSNPKVESSDDTIPTSSPTDSSNTTPTGGDTSSTGGEITTPTGDSGGSTTPTATSPTANTTAKPAPKPTQPTTAAKPSKNVGKGTPVASADKFVKNLKNDKDPKGSVFNGLKAKSSKVKKTSIKVTWSKVKKAKGYIVYGNKCGKSYKKIKTVKGTSYTQKKLKKGTYYKYLIMAYDKNNKILSTSKTLHVATTGGKYGNYKSVKLNKTKISLKKGKTYKLKATCKKQSKKLKVKDHRKVKYESTNTKIATVSSSGKIKAKKKGTCYIYAYAQNGVYKKAKVTVKK